MAREFGQFDSATWRSDQDWRALPADAQWLYMLLTSQTDLSAAGVLTLSIQRWQNMCADMAPERFVEALATLESRRFVYVDYDMEELLVRTFARRTQWGNGKRVAALRSAVSAMHSGRLRRALAAALAAVGRDVAGLPEMTPEIAAEFSGEPMTERSTEALPEPMPEALPNRSGNRSHVRACQTPDTRHQTPDTTLAPATAEILQLDDERTPGADEPRNRGRRRDELWEAVMGVCEIDTSAIPDSARGAYNRALAELRGVGATPPEVTRRAANYRLRYADAALTPTALVRRWPECDATPKRAGRPTTDDRVAAGIRLAEQLAGEGR